MRSGPSSPFSPRPTSPFLIYGGLDALALRFPTCYLFDAISDVLPASAVDFETSALESFWVRSEAKRGELCEVCTCVSSAANCTNRDLRTVPFGSDPITSLDLRGNPQLVLIGPGALSMRGCSARPVPIS